MGLAEVRQMLPHPVGCIRIERSRRLIEQQQLGLIDQRLRQRDAGLLPGREFSVGAIEKILEIEVGGELFDALGEILHRIEPAENGEVLPHREPHRHVDIGALEIHPAEYLGAPLGHRMTEHLNAPRGRQHQPHDHGDRRGLAGAIAAEQAGDAAARDPERHVIHRTGGLVELYEMRDIDRGGAFRPGRGRLCWRCLTIVHDCPFIGPSWPIAQGKPSCPGKSAKRVFAPDVPGIHVLSVSWQERRGWPGIGERQRRRPSGRLCPAMTEKAALRPREFVIARSRG